MSNDGNTVERLIRVKEAAGLLGVSSRTVWRMIADKQLQAVRVRGCTCVPDEQLRNLVRGSNNGEVK